MMTMKKYKITLSLGLSYWLTSLDSVSLNQQSRLNKSTQKFSFPPKKKLYFPKKNNNFGKIMSDIQLLKVLKPAVQLENFTIKELKDFFFFIQMNLIQETLQSSFQLKCKTKI